MTFPPSAHHHSGDPRQPDSAGGICVDHESVHSSGDTKSKSVPLALHRNHPIGKDSFMPRQPGTYASFTTSEGTIVCRLFEKDAPKTVANFTDLAEGKREWKHPSTGKKGSDRLYDGTIFHRVIPNFMLQGGDPQGTGMGGPGYQFEDETKGAPHNFDKSGKLALA